MIITIKFKIQQLIILLKIIIRIIRKDKGINKTIISFKILKLQIKKIAFIKHFKPKLNLRKN